MFSVSGSKYHAVTFKKRKKEKKKHKEAALKTRNAQLSVSFLFFLLLFVCAFHEVCEQITCTRLSVYSPTTRGW